MNMIMNKVVEEGTGRRAILDGVKAAGKTGTTNAYRDAWFVGYTGNYVAGVWVGNDDYAPTKRMTGGSLPAMTWRDIMAYAHQGIEMKTIPGRVAGTDAAAPPAAVARLTAAADATPPPDPSDQEGAADVLVRVERLMEDATRALAAPAGAAVGGPQRGADGGTPDSAPPRPTAARPARQLIAGVDGNPDSAFAELRSDPPVRLVLASLFAFLVAAARRPRRDVVHA